MPLPGGIHTASHTGIHVSHPHPYPHLLAAASSSSVLASILTPVAASSSSHRRRARPACSACSPLLVRRLSRPPSWHLSQPHRRRWNRGLERPTAPTKTPCMACAAAPPCRRRSVVPASPSSRRLIRAERERPSPSSPRCRRRRCRDAVAPAESAAVVGPRRRSQHRRHRRCRPSAARRPAAPSPHRRIMRRRWPHGHPPPTVTTGSCMLGHAFARRGGSGRPKPYKPKRKQAGDLNPTNPRQAGARPGPKPYRRTTRQRAYKTASRWAEAVSAVASVGTYRPSNPKETQKQLKHSPPRAVEHAGTWPSRAGPCSFEVWRKLDSARLHHLSHKFMCYSNLVEFP